MKVELSMRGDEGSLRIDGKEIQGVVGVRVSVLAPGPPEVTVTLRPEILQVMLDELGSIAFEKAG